MPVIVSVLASGWSVKGLDLARLPGHVIGVNDAGILSPRIDQIVSMDRLWTENRWERMSNLQRVAWIRFAALKNIKYHPWWLKPFWNSHKLTTPSDNYDVLNGTHSGMCALNLAYLQRPDIIFMFGFDHCRSPRGDPYWHEPYPWANPKGGTGEDRYQEWSRQYEPLANACAQRGIKVYNASPVSRIDTFQRANPRDVLERYGERDNADPALLRQPVHVAPSG